MSLYFPSASFLMEGVDEVDGKMVTALKVDEDHGVMLVGLGEGEAFEMRAYALMERVPVSNPQTVEDHDVDGPHGLDCQHEAVAS